MNKISGKRTEYEHFKYKTERGWYPRSISKPLVDKITAQWDEEGVEYERINESEIEKLGQELDLP